MTRPSEVIDIQDQLNKALERVGRNSVDAMRWLIHFAGCQIDNLSIGQFNDLMLEMAAFQQNGPHYEKGSRPFIVADRNWLSWRDIVTGRAPRREEVRSVQKDLLAHIGKLLNEGTSTFLFPQFHVQIWRSDDDPPVSPIPIVKDPRDAFFYYVAHLLARHGHQIMFCQECTQLMFARQRTQKFCSIRCQSRASTRMWRESHAKGPRRKRARPPVKNPSFKLRSKSKQKGR